MHSARIIHLHIRNIIDKKIAAEANPILIPLLKIGSAKVNTRTKRVIIPSMIPRTFLERYWFFISLDIIVFLYYRVGVACLLCFAIDLKNAGFIHCLHHDAVGNHFYFRVVMQVTEGVLQFMNCKYTIINGTVKNS